jgi:uncharacterized protein (DUF2062 family)
MVGFPITMVPFLPAQSAFATVAAIFIRGNLVLCIALQFLSSPLTAPVQLPACYFVGEVVRGRSPTAVWREITDSTADVFTGDSLLSLYMGALVLGVSIGLLGYLGLKNFGRQAWPENTPLARAKIDKP